MKHFKIFMVLALLLLVLTSCNLKLNLSTNLNENRVQIEPTNSAHDNQNTNEVKIDPVSGLPAANQQVSFDFVLADEGWIKKIINKSSQETWINDLQTLCGNEMMLFAHPENSMKVVLKRFNPGSDLPVRDLYLLNLQEKICKKLDVSADLSDFGARVLSPDQTKLAVVLETDEAKVLKVLDLFADQSTVAVNLGEGETLNGGYGAISNKFDIQWQGSDKIQYTVYEDTIKNYDTNAPEAIEKVKEVRLVNIY